MPLICGNRTQRKSPTSWKENWLDPPVQSLVEHGRLSMNQTAVFDQLMLAVIHPSIQDARNPQQAPLSFFWMVLNMWWTWDVWGRGWDALSFPRRIFWCWSWDPKLRSKKVTLFFPTSFLYANRHTAFQDELLVGQHKSPSRQNLL
jgi:hypothetical protein